MYWYDLAAGQLKTLHEGRSKFKYKGLSISEDACRQPSFSMQIQRKALIRHHQLLMWKNGEATAHQYDIENSLALPPSWLLSDAYTPCLKGWKQVVLRFDANASRARHHESSRKRS